MTRETCTAYERKRKHRTLLAVVIIGAVIFACISNVGTSSPTAVSASPTPDRYGSGNVPSDPSAYMYGFHLYNVTNWSIPSTGGDFNLTFPTGWNVTALGLNFFNGSLTKDIITNSTPIKTSVMTNITGGFFGSVNLNKPNNWKIPQNSTVYQVQFNITALTIGQPSYWASVKAAANSTYPSIDGNIGAAQRFFIANSAQNLTIQLSVFRLDGTSRNFDVDVRSSTSDNHIGGLVKSVSLPPSVLPLAKAPVTIRINYVNLTAGYYFIVLHTQDWLSSGGGYIVDTTLSRQPSNPSSGWLTSDRGVSWQNQTEIAGTRYYFNGFRLSVLTVPKPIPSEMNLEINGFPVADTLIWNQTVWNSVSPYTFAITSDYQIPLLNLTYKAWVYAYKDNRLFPKQYHIMINADKNKNTTAIDSTRAFTTMYALLGATDLSKSGVVNYTTSEIKLNLKLFANNSLEIAGMLNVTAVAQLQMAPVSETYTGPYSLKLQFIISHKHPGGPYNNVTLTETALAIGPITSQIDNVIINNKTVSRNRWSHNSRSNFLNITREAFNLTSIPQFTLLYGSSFNTTVTIFNNSTAIASTVVKGTKPYVTPVASMEIRNTSSILDIDSSIQAYITVTNTSGFIINKTLLSLTGGLYKFNTTLTGEGVYGIRITSVDHTGYNATRWLGVATVDDYQLSSPIIRLNPSGNMTSRQNLTISANVTYLNHVNQPAFTFEGTVNFSIYLGETGTAVKLMATKNNATGLYQAVYQVPAVDSATLLTIRVEARDLKNRISTNLASTYLLPANNLPPPNPEPSGLWLIELAIVAVLLLVPIFAYFLEKYRKR